MLTRSLSELGAGHKQATRPKAVLNVFDVPDGEGTSKDGNSSRLNRLELHCHAAETISSAAMSAMGRGPKSSLWSKAKKAAISYDIFYIAFCSPEEKQEWYSAMKLSLQTCVDSILLWSSCMLEVSKPRVMSIRNSKLLYIRHKGYFPVQRQLRKLCL